MVSLFVKNKKQLAYLLSLPIIEQKTEIWYKAREGMISASDFAQALGEGKFGSQKQLIQKKCEPVNESAFSLTNPFFRWGNMFEQVAIDIYSLLNNGIKIHSFGLIKHPKYDFFGASPDGISDDGIMVEIKCPYKRKIDGEIPKQYYYQIQGQLDVCDLDECDYFECEFVQVNNVDILESKKNDIGFCGVMIESNDKKIVYGPILHGENKNLQDLKNFINEKMQLSDNVIIWYLEKYNKKRVIRDKVFMDTKIKEVEKIWNKILFYRKNKEKYTLEVLNTFDILDTEIYKSKNKTKQNTYIEEKQIRGYAFQDLSD
jgi:putative phage-type endonuclease